MNTTEKYPFLQERPSNVRVFVRLKPETRKVDFEAPFAWFEFSQTSDEQVWELHTGAGPTAEMLHKIFGETNEEVELFFEKNFPKQFDRELSFPLRGGVSSVSLLAAMHLNPAIESFTYMLLDSGAVFWYGREHCTSCFFSDFTSPAMGQVMHQIQHGAQTQPSTESVSFSALQQPSFWRKLLPLSRKPD